MKNTRLFITMALALAVAPAMAEELPLSGAAYRIAEDAYAAYARGDYARAVEQAREAVRLRPDVARLHDLLRTAETARAGIAATPAAASTPQRVMPAARPSVAVPDRRQRAWQAGDEAYRMYNVGRFADAEQQARLSLQLDANNPPMHALLVYALEKQERLQDAARAADAALTVAADDETLQALRDRLYRRLATRPAAEAWASYHTGDHVRALASANEAIALAPDVPSYRYLQLGALLRQSRHADAVKAATEALAQDEEDTYALVMRAYAESHGGDVAAARADLDRALAQDWLSEQQVAAVKRMAADIDNGETSLGPPEVFCTGSPDDLLCGVAPAGGGQAGPGYEHAARAYAAYAAHDYDAAAGFARQALAAEEAHVGYRVLLADALTMSGNAAEAHTTLAPLVESELPPEQLLAAAYAAQRSYRNDWASRWFRQAVDAIDAGTLEQDATARHNITAAISDLERTWGFNAALGYGTVGVMNPAFAPSLNARRTLQASQEVYWRPPVIGNRNGGRVELYARTGQALYDGTGGATGMSTNQAVLGARWKPFRQQNLVLAAERFVHSGRYSRNDWLLRAAWSEGRGGGLRVDVDSWNYWQVYAEADHFIENPQTLGTLDARYGRAYRLDRISPRLVVTPYLSLNGGYDSLLAERSTLGAGAGMAMRTWFRGDGYHAPRSFVEFTIQYRERLAGDDRSQGVFAGLHFSY